eukprot:Protomagalhaensia_sp_Gyna_25__1913@NODE_2013_length_1346_cov_7_843917_g1660_i0_p1_GENE_NODE_2013_length_1346_cov_7_843917_g1660_i0NODE_2013_length_1346_cov_7_843917_g1660_i0_p1_ORF_typecomplete_len383_score41_47Hint/PF01079_20/8_2e16Vint/PF14623_6/2_5e05Hom_end_hint/PF05203_16/0_0087Hint_2/PF13403_6/0_41_NODE_2013_length_1346_cov_7_843917_g1660_i0311179
MLTITWTLLQIAAARRTDSDRSFLQLVPGVAGVLNAGLGQQGSSLRSSVGAIAQSLMPTSCISDTIAIGSVGRNEDDYPFVPNCNFGGSSDMSCFHSSTEVLLQNGDVKPIIQLRLGDKLASPRLIGGGGSEPNVVEGFLHAGKGTRWVFLQAGNATLRVTPMHLIPIRRKKEVLVTAAASIQPHSDSVEVRGQWVRVIRRQAFETEAAIDFVAPITTNGWLVADGFGASIFSELPTLEAVFLKSLLGTEISTAPETYMKSLKLLLRLYRVPALGRVVREVATRYLSVSRHVWRFWTWVWEGYVGCDAPTAAADRPQSIGCVLSVLPIPNLDHEPVLEVLRSSGHQLLWLIDWYVALISSVAVCLEKAFLFVRPEVAMFKQP